MSFATRARLLGSIICRETSSMMMKVSWLKKKLLVCNHHHELSFIFSRTRTTLCNAHEKCFWLYCL